MVYSEGQQRRKQWPYGKIIGRLVQGLSFFVTSNLKSAVQVMIKAIAICLCTMFSFSAWAEDFRDCSQNFYQSTEPDYINQKLLNQSVPLCFNGFATLYSGVTRTPLWSAEYLTRERLLQAEEIPREDSFHSERRLPDQIQAELSDYKGSGYDRGHLAPNADMANESQQYDSFSLANIIPQTPENNRYVWKNIESVTRYLTKKYSEVYVVTGVAFTGNKVTQINKRVMVPSYTFKAIYVPETGEAGAYYAPNDDSKRLEVISIDQLALHSGIDVFPGISAQAKATAMDLPESVGDIADRGDYNNPEPNQSQQQQQEKPLWYLILVEILSWLVNNFLNK